jgi:hypothetical protein
MIRVDIHRQTTICAWMKDECTAQLMILTHFAAKSRICRRHHCWPTVQVACRVVFCWITYQISAGRMQQRHEDAARYHHGMGDGKYAAAQPSVHRRPRCWGALIAKITL